MRSFAVHGHTDTHTHTCTHTGTQTCTQTCTHTPSSLLSLPLSSQDACSQSQSTVCADGKSCFLIKELCSQEVDGTADCPGVCDYPLVFDVADVPAGTDTGDACREPCSQLAERDDLGGRQLSCETGCGLAEQDTEGGRSQCETACSIAEDAAWELECVEACDRFFDIYATTDNEASCSSAKSNCTQCAALGCTWCQISQAGTIVFNDCLDNDNTASLSDCVELSGSLVDEPAECPAFADPCASELPCTDMQCDDGEYVMTFPLQDGECCPQQQCVSEGACLLCSVSVF